VKLFHQKKKPGNCRAFRFSRKASQSLPPAGGKSSASLLPKKGFALFGQSQYQIPKKRFPFSQVACSTS
jgi:hypothetical protein